MIKKENSKVELAARLFSVGIFVLLGFLVFKYAIGILLPFAFAYVLSLIVIPLSSALSKRTRLPRKLCAALLVTLALALFGTLVFWSVIRLAEEAAELIERTAEGEGELSLLVERVRGAWDALAQKFAVFGGVSKIYEAEFFGKSVQNIVYELMQNAISSLSTSLAKSLTSLVTRAPSILLSLFVTLMACYLLSMDKDGFGALISRIIPENMHSRVKKITSLASHALKRYARAYVLLMALTFVEVFIGLAILKVKYSFLIAIGIAIVDILPVLGAGTVLIPWSAFSFLLGDFRLGLGLLILYGVLTIVRQIAEVRLVGTSIGLHPLAALFSMYAGLRLFGVFGIILGPAAAYIFLELTNTKKDLAEN